MKFRLTVKRTGDQVPRSYIVEDVQFDKPSKGWLTAKTPNTTPHRFRMTEFRKLHNITHTT